MVEIKPLFTWRTAIIRSTLHPTTRHVLITLSLWMNEAGLSAFPSTRKQAGATGLSERTVCTHLQIAVDSGWLKKSAHGYAGQKWKRHEYEPLIPQEALKEVQHVGTERDSAASKKGTEPNAKGTEPNDKKALKEVQSNTPYNSPKNTPDKFSHRFSSPVGIKKYIEHCQVNNKMPIPECDSVFDYFEKSNIPSEYWHLAWLFFRDEMIEKQKKQKDWRGYFRNAIKGDWLKLWAVNRDGEFFLTTKGKQANEFYKEDLAA